MSLIMKPILITPQWGLDDCTNYGRELLSILVSKYGVVVYDHIDEDFSNIPELFDETEKLLLFSQYFTESLRVLRYDVLQKS